MALGSNLGDRLQYLQNAVKLLLTNSDVVIKKMSGIYETNPVGYIEQGTFLNAVIKVESALLPERFLELLLETEHVLGRARTFPNAPRTIDMDLLFAGDSIINEPPGLIVPHPRIFERAFVLVPLAEIAADQVHPVLQISVGEMLERVKGREGVWWYSKFFANDSVPIEN